MTPYRRIERVAKKMDVLRRLADILEEKGYLDPKFLRTDPVETTEEEHEPFGDLFEDDGASYPDDASGFAGPANNKNKSRYKLMPDHGQTLTDLLKVS
tara:strand:- start:131805 stop:132098 length:294 start_codon:yes stop_codon:yes gene_type:complete